MDVQNFHLNKRGESPRQQTQGKLKIEQKMKLWSNCTKLVLSAIWNSGLIAQLVRASKHNLVIVASNPIQDNFLLLALKILQQRIPYVSAHSATLMWLPLKNLDKNECDVWRRQWPKRNLNTEQSNKLE